MSPEQDTESNGHFRQSLLARLPGSVEFCDPFAIRLLVSNCVRCTFMPSVVLHVVEFTFSRGFDSFRAHHLFNHLPGLMF
jgi:hypothetical protein